MTVEETRCCNEIYGLFSWNAEETNNEVKDKRVNNPNECKNMNSAITEGKYEHNDNNVICNLEVRNLTLENDGGIGRDGTLQGRSSVGSIHSYDVEGLDKREDSSLSLDRLRMENGLLIISISSTCFGQCFRPSSEALDCVHSLWYNPPAMLPACSL